MGSSSIRPPKREGGAPKGHARLPQEVWELVATHLELAADKARLCLAVKCLCRATYLQSCYLLHLAERELQCQEQVVSLPLWLVLV